MTKRQLLMFLINYSVAGMLLFVAVVMLKATFYEQLGADHPGMIWVAYVWIAANCYAAVNLMFYSKRGST
jgi:hypothetical protein